MKPTVFLSLIAASIALGLTGSHASAQTLKPESLLCEDCENPLGADMPKPRLSWMANPAAPLLRGLRQTAYQILAASSPQLLARDQGDLWDSGKVTSPQMNQIAYAGKSLLSSQAVYWKVRLWDQSGVVSAWSPAATWTMGLLTEADWQKAKWIGAPDNDKPFDEKEAIKGPKDKYETVLLRRNLTVKVGLKRAVVHVCGLAQYEMTLNGSKVGDIMLTPGWTAYAKTCLYDTYDITSSLHAGANTVGLFLGNGFYNTHNGRYTKVRGSFGPLQAISLIHLEYADGTMENIVTDEKWKTASGPIIFSSIYGGEDYDARLLQKGWDQPNFNDLSWEKPGITQGPGGALKSLSASAPPIRQIQVLTPVGKKEITPNVTVYDLGQNASIMAFIKVKGRAGSTVKVTPSELVHENGDINERMCDNNSYCTYTLSGQGEESYQWKFYYRGGQYLRVETTAASGGELPKVSLVEGRVIRADAPVVGKFETSSELVNRIYHLVYWAQMSNMMSVMTDCPHREKLGWLEETQLNGPALRYNFDMTGIFRKVVNDMADAQRENGLVPSLVPNYYHWDEGKYTTPIQWGSAFILVPWQQYEFAGDARMLKERYEAMKNYMSYLSRRAENHIVSFGLGDWYDNLGEGEPTLTPVALTDTAFFYQDYVIMAKIATVLGEREDAAKFEKSAAEVRKVFNDKFYNPATGNYSTGSQGSNCLPISMNIAQPDWRAAVSRNLFTDLQAKNTTTGEVSYRYLLRALADADLNALVYSTYTSETNGYGLQVKLGKTTLTEAWNGGNSSQNHFMFGQINEWYFRDLAGIQCAPEAPGFEKIIIKPALVGDLTWVKASYRSIRGDIVSQWTNRPAGLTMNVTIPVGATATIYVPAANSALVKESNTPAASAPGLRYLRMENGAAVYAAVSGSYSFSSNSAATPPARLTATPQAGQVTLAWSPSVNGSNYIIKRSLTPGTGYMPLPARITGTTYTDAAVKNGTTYYYTVSAVNTFGEGRATEASATPAAIINAGFESPKISGYLSNPQDAGWQFTPMQGNNGSGITTNGSSYTGQNPEKIPQGIQAAYLQGNGTISQSLSGFNPGATYTLTYSAAQRVSGNQGGQTWQVKLDAKVIGEFSPNQQTGTTYQQFQATFRPTAKRQVLSFVGTNTRGGDNTIFIDNVRITGPGM